MDYPLFLVPHIGGGWLIGIVAILHVIISHFAVGGGLLVVATEQVAARRADSFRLAFAQKLSTFLVLLSAVLGAITGVGIWFTIGLVQPAATAALIHAFVWGWAIEWVFFVIEIAAALLYYGTWDKVSRRLHLTIGWIYFGAAYISLVIINGIITFMLTPGLWLQTRSFWDGIFNPTYWPSLLLRTGITLMMAGVFSWLVAAWIRDAEGRRGLVRYLSGWTLGGVILTALGFLWWQANIPADARALVFPEGALLRSSFVLGAGMLALLAAVVVALGYLLPRGFGIVAAILAVLLAGTAFGSFERVREGSRKPFVIHGYMYSNGIRVDEVERLNKEGVLTKLKWAGLGVPAGPLAKGEQVFRGECQMCHSTGGYLAIRKYVEGQDAEGLAAFLEALRGGRPGMPPIVGTEEEIKALAEYLASLGGASQLPLAGAAMPAPGVAPGGAK
jgi:cytochrome bd-type quinol oxidase subunit 1